MTLARKPAQSLAELDCLVLCGGLGTRLRGIGGDLPKAMVEVGGRPFLEWLLSALQCQGVRRVVLATGYRAEAIHAHFADGAARGMEISYSHEPEPLGTAGALRHALPMMRSDPVLVVNGDTYTRIPLAAMLTVHRSSAAEATLLAVPSTERDRYGALELHDDGRVSGFAEKHASGGGWISAGAYLIARAVVERIPLGRAVSLEADVLPTLVGSGLRAVRGQGPFVDIGTPDSFQAAASILAQEVEGCRA